ncbi:prolyl oligopeptidase family serine peptidase [Kitasatospora sp. NPDC004669]|uniref:prolyl oligopeptidase family serine peptidase n=1 Tax=Kitasatospora sp. NPDC004669 TaxID=3154555 RepID=UPI0033A1DC8F
MHVIVLPGGGYAAHAPHEAEPIVAWLVELGLSALDALVTPASPPVFLWHTAEDVYVPPEHTYRLASALAAHEVPHTVHVFAHGPHSLGLAQGAGDASTWTRFAEAWIAEQFLTPLPSTS